MTCHDHNNKPQSDNATLAFRFWRKALLLCVLVPAGICVAIAILLYIFGLPKPVLKAVITHISKTGVEVQPEKVRVIYPLTLALENPKIRTHMGSAIFTFESKSLRVRFWTPSLSLPSIRPEIIHIFNGTVTIVSPNGTVLFQLTNLNLVASGDSSNLWLLTCDFTFGGINIHAKCTVSNLPKNFLEFSPKRTQPHPETKVRSLPSEYLSSIANIYKVASESKGAINLKATINYSSFIQSAGNLEILLQQMAIGDTVVENLVTDISFQPSINASNTTVFFDIRSDKVYHPVRNVKNSRLGGTLVLDFQCDRPPMVELCGEFREGVWDLGTFEKITINASVQPKKYHTAKSVPSKIFPLFELISNVDLTATIGITNFSLWGGPVDRFITTVNWSYPKLLFTNLVLGVKDGEVRATAIADLSSSTIQFNLHSQCNPRYLWPFLSDNGRRIVGQFDWFLPPNIILSGSLPLPKYNIEHGDFSPKISPYSINLSGKINATQFAYKALKIDKADLEFLLTNGTVCVSKGVLNSADSQVTFQLTRALTQDGLTIISIAGAINPTLLTPLLPTPAKQILDRFAFSQLITTKGKAILRARQNLPEVAEGSITATNFTYLGHLIEFLNTSVTYSNAMLLISNPVVSISNQTAYADSITVDLSNSMLGIQNAYGVIYPHTVVELVSPKTAITLKPFNFLSAPTGSISGKIPLRGSKEINLKLELRGNQFQWWRLKFQDYDAAVQIVNDQLDLNVQKCKFYRGNLQLQGHFDWSPTIGTDFRFSSTFTNVDLNYLLTDILTTSNKTAGALTGQLIITSANTADYSTWNGYGSALLKDGYLWELPMFSILSPVIDSAFPGLGSTRFSEGTASFIITNGVVNFSLLSMRSPLMEMILEGTVDYHGYLNMRLIANIFKELWVVGPVISGIMSPFIKAFEFHITGPISSPSIKPLYLPKELTYPLRPFKWIFDQLPNHKQKKRTSKYNEINTPRSQRTGTNK